MNSNITSDASCITTIDNDILRTLFRKKRDQLLLLTDQQDSFEKDQIFSIKQDGQILCRLCNIIIKNKYLMPKHRSNKKHVVSLEMMLHKKRPRDEYEHEHRNSQQPDDFSVDGTELPQDFFDKNNEIEHEKEMFNNDQQTDREKIDINEELERFEREVNQYIMKKPNVEFVDIKPNQLEENDADSNVDIKDEDEEYKMKIETIKCMKINSIVQHHYEHNLTKSLIINNSTNNQNISYSTSDEDCDDLKELAFDDEWRSK